MGGGPVRHVDRLCCDPQVPMLPSADGRPCSTTVTSTPNPIEPPVTRVQRIGGSDDGVSDYPCIEVAAYGSDRQQAWALAEQCRQVILASPRTVVGSQLVDRARTDTPHSKCPTISLMYAASWAIYRFS